MAIAYGQITLVDLTDLGNFSVTPQSNSPLTQIYNPNTSSFTPDWTASNVELTAACYYGATDVSSNVALSWQRQDGSGTVGNLTSGETYSSTTRKLTINQNVLNASGTNLITYYCTATYTEPESGVVLTAKGQITFNMQKVADTIKTCEITGNNVFLYDGNGNITGASTITLNSRLVNGSIGEWKYKNAAGNFVSFSPKKTANTLEIAASDSAIFNSNVATIKLFMADHEDTVYDIFTITKIHDGAAGSSTVSMVLTNDNQMVPVDSDGNGTFTGGIYNTSALVYESGADKTSDYTISVKEVSGLTGSLSGTKYTVSGMTAETGYVILQAVKTGDSAPIYTKRFTLVKIKSGADGKTPTYYSIKASAYAANHAVDGSFTPSSITFNSYVHSYDATNGWTETAYDGRIRIVESKGSTTTVKQDTGYDTDRNTCTYTFTSSTATPALTSITAKLYAAGGETTLLDSQDVVITSDGPKGEQGDAGKDSYNIILGNEAEMIPCTSAGDSKATQTIVIDYKVYKGITDITSTLSASDIVVTGMPTGITSSVNHANKRVTLTVKPNSPLGGNNSGEITITFGTIGSKIFSWAKSIQAADGVNAVIFQLYSSSNTIKNQSGSTTINTMLTNGSEQVTGVNYQWYKYGTNDYEPVSGGTSASSLTVEGSSVDSVAFYKCVATYGGKSYTAYYTIYDKSDPVQVELLSTIGDTIKNNTGVGAVYPYITRNGQEIFPMKKYGDDGIKFVKSTEAMPTGRSTNDYVYVIDTTNKTVVLKHYTGSAWVTDATAETGISYNYSFLNSAGVSTDYNGSSNYTGKILYVDGSLITNKIVVTLQVEVTG